MPPSRSDETALVVAAQAGDRRALDELTKAYLPFVYTIVRRTLADDADVDDVVQESMVRAVRELRGLRTPESFRAWLGAIAVRQTSTHLRRRHAAERRTEPLADCPDANAPFEGLTLLRLAIAQQRRQAARAARWLSHDERMLLSLWWLEVAGHLTRAELAQAAGISLAHAGVRIQRLRQQFDQCRALVAALDARPRCRDLDQLVAGWDGVPHSAWRKRIARHIRTCDSCTPVARDLLAPEQLLVGLALLPVPLALTAALIDTGALKGAASLAAATAPPPGGPAHAGAGHPPGTPPPGTSASGTTPTGGALAGAAPSGFASLATVLTGPIKSGIFGFLARGLAAYPIVTAAVVCSLVVGTTLALAKWPAIGPGPRPGSGSGAASPSPTRTSPPLLTLGPASLEAGTESGLFVTTSATLGIVAPLSAASSPSARQQATFEVVPGLADPRCFSFRSRDGRYLRHASWRLRLNAHEGSRLFEGDATFCARPGPTAASVHLESSNYPGWWLHRRGDQLWVDQPDGTVAFAAQSSFRIRPPLAA